MRPVLLPFPEDRALAAELATHLDARIGRLHWRHFPDGESLVTIDEDLAGREVIVLASLRDPDRKALPLLFAARTAREFGAHRVGLVAPYLAYMRQDTRFHPGEAVSARWFAAFIDGSFDWLVTVDPHLHRNPSLDVLFRTPATCVSAATAVADWIRSQVERPLLLGPDSESEQWVARIAALADAPFQVLSKVRRGDRDVEISRPSADVMGGHTPVLVDDIVSSGHTLIQTLHQLRALGLPPALCVAIHAVFADGALEGLRSAGPGAIVTTNTIAHSTNTISVAQPIAEAVTRLLGESAHASA